MNLNFPHLVFLFKYSDIMCVMQVAAYKTKKVLPNDDLYEILRKSLPKKLPEKSVVAVTSKIIALSQGRVAEDTEENRDRLVKKESQWYLPRYSHKYDFCISIKHNTFTATAGIDRSNGNGKLVLWPKNVQRAVDDIREFLVRAYNVMHVGVVTTDSKTSPLRWGVTGFAIAHSGFNALKSYIGVPDVFGRPLHFERTNIADSLAASAVTVMGEGGEQTPLAIVTDIPFVEFQNRNPTKEELEMLKIELEDDVFYPLLTAIKWEKGEDKEE